MISHEEGVLHQLVNKFSFLQDKVKVPRPRRIFIEVSMPDFYAVFLFIKNDLGFAHLCTITGLDEGENIGLIYHLAREDGVLLNLKTCVPKNDPHLKSIINDFPGAEIYERELADLLGVRVEGLPEGCRYPLTDDWPHDQYPLRKDWKPNSNEDKK